MRSTFFPLELRFHPFFQFLLISAKCHNPLENHGRNEHHIFFIFAFPNFFLAWRWKMLFLHCVLQCFMFFSEMVWSIELPFSSRKNLMFVRAETETFYISHGWLKMCGQLNFQRSNIFQPSNIFQDSTSSNPLHMTLLHPPPPPHPPTPPSVNETFNVATSSNQATSSRIQHHPLHFTWRYYTPPTPSVNNNETFNVATSSNQATSSSTQHHPTHFTWRYYTPPPPPPPLL